MRLGNGNRRSQGDTEDADDAGAAQRSEYQTNELRLRVLDPAVTCILHKMHCNKCLFRFKNSGEGLALSLDPTPFSTSCLKMTLHL